MSKLQNKQLSQYALWVNEGEITRSKLRTIIEERNSWKEYWGDGGVKMAHLKAEQQKGTDDLKKRYLMIKGFEKLIDELKNR